MITDDLLHQIAQEAKVGQELGPPAGLEIQSTREGRIVTKRPQKIRPHFVHRYPNQRFYSRFGEVYQEELGWVDIVWAGSGGYWKTLSILNDPDDIAKEFRY